MAEEKDTTPIELQTFTNLWRVDRKIYRFYDINLPFPVSLRQIGIVIAFCIPWFGLMKLLHIPMSPPFGHLIWLFPPGAVGWYANKPLIENKSLSELAISQIKFLLAPRLITKFNSPNKTKELHVVASIWNNKNARIIKPLDEDATQYDMEHHPEDYIVRKRKSIFNK